jgi:hypothetical protein
MAIAETVYKCVENGKTRFTSTPTEVGTNCQPLDLHVPQANPAELAQQEKKERKAAAEDRAEDAKIRELLKNDPDRISQAQRMEAAKSLARQPVPVPNLSNSRGRRGAGNRGYQ